MEQELLVADAEAAAEAAAAAGPGAVDPRDDSTVL